MMYESDSRGSSRKPSDGDVADGGLGSDKEDAKRFKRRCVGSVADRVVRQLGEGVVVPLTAVVSLLLLSSLDPSTGRLDSVRERAEAAGDYSFGTHWWTGAQLLQHARWLGPAIVKRGRRLAYALTTEELQRCLALLGDVIERKWSKDGGWRYCAAIDASARVQLSVYRNYVLPCLCRETALACALRGMEALHTRQQDSFVKSICGRELLLQAQTVGARVAKGFPAHKHLLLGQSRGAGEASAHTSHMAVALDGLVREGVLDKCSSQCACGDEECTWALRASAYAWDVFASAELERIPDESSSSSSSKSGNDAPPAWQRRLERRRRCAELNRVWSAQLLLPLLLDAAACDEDFKDVLVLALSE